MMPPDTLRSSDSAVVARFLQIRSVIHDRHLARIERLILDRYWVTAIRRVPPTLVADVRCGFMRPGEGEMWPVVFMTMVDISMALCLQIPAERVANMGTMVNGPYRIRHHNWDQWWGWERPLSQMRPDFFDLSATEQEETIALWYTEGLEWLVGGGLLRRR